VGLVTPVAPVPLADLGRVHFTGIGGAGMSGIARIMIARGVTVSGSDSAGGDQLAALAALGADVHVGHAAANVAGADDGRRACSRVAVGTPDSESWQRGQQHAHNCSAEGHCLQRRGCLCHHRRTSGECF